MIFSFGGATSTYVSYGLSYQSVTSDWNFTAIIIGLFIISIFWLYIIFI